MTILFPSPDQPTRFGEEKESAREDPTFDEYHNMKGKKEDDDSKPKSANESMQSNQSADLLIHVELERLSKCSRFQLKPVKGSGVLDGVCYPTIIYMIRPFSEQNLWWFCDFHVQILMTMMIAK